MTFVLFYYTFAMGVINAHNTWLPVTVIELLKYITTSLDRLEIAYMLSGGLAFNAYSIPRMTRDIDIVIELQMHHLSDFIKLFRQHFYYDEQNIKEEIRRRGMFNIIDQKSGYKIDFMMRQTSEYGYVAFSRRIHIAPFGFSICIITLEDLVLAKVQFIQQYQSELHMRDIHYLLENPEADKDYILHWCKELKLNTYDLF